MATGEQCRAIIPQESIFCATLDCCNNSRSCWGSRPYVEQVINAAAWQHLLYHVARREPACRMDVHITECLGIVGYPG